MELTISSVHYPHTWPVLVCLCWSFAVLALLAPRGRSAGPVAASLVPLAVFTASLCAGLIDTMRGVVIGGGGRASTAAGIAESFVALYGAAFFVVVVFVFAAFRAHRPLADRLTATLFALLLIDVGVARVAAATLALPAWQYPAAISGAIAALVIAIIAAVWTFLAGRGRVKPRAIPFGITMMLAVAVMVGVMVWQTVQHYRAIAIHG